MKLAELQHEPDHLEGLWEMADLSPRMTGCEHTIFVSPSYEAPHACRIKVCNTRGKVVPADMFVIDLKNLEVVAGTCKLSSDELEQVKWWIHRNRFVILDYWKGRIDTGEMLMSIKPITEDYDPTMDTDNGK